jgi:phenylacetate-CoA ligase
MTVAQGSRPPGVVIRGSRPFSEELWDEREQWTRDRIIEHQRAALREQLIYVGQASGWYAGQWRELGFDPREGDAIEQLRWLPVTTKHDYLRAIQEEPPWGSALAAEMTEVRRVHFSSGTTAEPTPMCWTDADLDRWTDVYARMAYSQGVRAADVYQCLFSYSWFVGGLGTTASYERIGSTVLPGGSVDSERQVRTIFRYGTTAVAGTPSFILHLAEVAERMGLDLRTSAVRTIMVGGEPGGAIGATRRQIEERWDARCHDGYGSLEFQPIAWECEAQAGGHLAEDFALSEILDPETHEPVADGEPGVLVLTHLDKRACPLVRWWTGDVVVRDATPCACGRTHARLPGGVRGRADDMLVIRGVNLFPSAVEEVVRGFPGTTGEYRIVLDDELRSPTTGYLEAIKVQVEQVEGGGEGIGARLEERLRGDLKVRAIVQVVPFGGLPRTTHKANRVVKR